MSVASSSRSSKPIAIIEEPKGPKPTPEELEEFKNQVAQWIHLDEQVKKLSIAIRERKCALAALTPIVQSFMHKFNYDDLNTQSGKIRTTTRVVKTPVTLTDVRVKLLELEGGDALVHKIFEENRGTKEKTSIRRIVPKVSLSLDI